MEELDTKEKGPRGAAIEQRPCQLPGLDAGGSFLEQSRQSSSRILSASSRLHGSCRSPSMSIWTSGLETA